MKTKSLTAIAFLGLVLSAAGCGGSSSSSPPPPPPPPAPPVLVWAANQNNTITSYDENAGPNAQSLVTLSDPYEPLYLNPGQQAAFQNGSNLWVANSGANTLIAISPENLSASGTIDPSLTIADPAGESYINDPHGIAFDAKGNLWAANDGNDTLIEYTGQQLTANPADQPFTFPPATTITDSSNNLRGPNALTFDQQGDLWVSSADNDTLEMFTPAQLASGGAVTPTVIANPLGSPGYLSRPHGLVFDTAGDLWVINSADDALFNVVSYSADQLAALTPGKINVPLPTTTLANSSTGPAAFAHPNFGVFDQDGNLWIANQGSYSAAAPPVVQLSAASITGPGDLTPEPTISIYSSANGVLYDAYCLLFDSSGNLIVTNKGYDDPILKYSPSSLTESGSPDPAVALDNPAFVNLPINSTTSMTVDNSNNLWVANSPYGVPGSIVEFPSTISTTSNPVPIQTITDPTGQTLFYPNDIRFDASHNLWVANTSSPWGSPPSISDLVMYSAQSIAAGKPVQTVVISLPPDSDSVNFQRFTLDSSGNVWIAGYSYGYDDEYQTYVLEYSKAQIAQSGSPIPTTILKGVPYFEDPVGIGFDGGGDLWVSSDYYGSSLNYALAASYSSPIGPSSTPVAGIVGPGTDAQDLKFDADNNLLMLEGDAIYEYSASALAAVDKGGTIAEAQDVISGPLSGLDFPYALAIENAN